MMLENVTRMTELFKKEIESYYAYKDLLQRVTEDSLLEEALEEIMYDEYLHARFLRQYMQSNDLYKFTAVDEPEKRFLMMDKD